jgi:hypothetical protein
MKRSLFAELRPRNVFRAGAFLHCRHVGAGAGHRAAKIAFKVTLPQTGDAAP